MAEQQATPSGGSPETPEMDVLWRPADLDRFDAFSLEDGRIVYDKLTGRTHVLNVFADLVFSAIETQPRTPEQINQLLSTGAQDSSFPHDDGLLEAVRQILADFQQIELAESSTC